MTTPSTRTSRSTLDDLEKVFLRLQARLGEMGLTLSIWDAEGRRVGELAPACEICSLSKAAARSAQSAQVRLARQVVQSHKPCQGRCALGCGLVGVPILQRRRLAGAALACFPVHEMLDEEALARACDSLALDRTVVTDMLRRAGRHSVEAAGEILALLESLLRSEQATAVAQDELATLSTNLAVTYEELSLLYTISHSMKLTQRPEDFFRSVCTEMLEVMNLSAAAAVLYPYPAGGADTVVLAGNADLTPEALARLARERIAPRLEQEKGVLVDNRFGEGPSGGGGIRGLVAAPLRTETCHIGMLLGLNKNSGEFDSADLKLIGSIGNQASVFLANSRLYADLQDLLMGVLHALTATIDAKDPYTCGHSQRVAMIARRLAEMMGFGPEKVQQIYLSGLLHDIGKIGIPEAILCKAGRLTDEEYGNMKRHPLLGAKILEGIRQLDDVISGILNHHERPDGRGYPAGRSGDEVPLEGLIVGLADCFDAMTSDRTYRKALPLPAVIREIRRQAGTQFDPRLVDLLLSKDLEELLRELRRGGQGPAHDDFVREIKP